MKMNFQLFTKIFYEILKNIKKSKKVVDIYRHIGYSKQVDREHPLNDMGS